MTKKKIKDLTKKERLDICDKHVYSKYGCNECPLNVDDICVHHVLNVLEREVEIK